VIDQARAAGVPARICGEMGGRPLEAMALIGLGADKFSITPAGVGPMKAMVRSLNASAIRGKMDQLLVKPPRDTRRVLSEWARRHKVVIE
jgi:phosphotransferase system enzyme I (PtsP)